MRYSGALLVIFLAGASVPAAYAAESYTAKSVDGNVRYLVYAGGTAGEKGQVKAGDRYSGCLIAVQKGSFASLISESGETIELPPNFIYDLGALKKDGGLAAFRAVKMGADENIFFQPVNPYSGQNAGDPFQIENGEKIARDLLEAGEIGLRSEKARQIFEHEALDQGAPQFLAIDTIDDPADPAEPAKPAEPPAVSAI